MPGFLSPGKGVPRLLIPEYSVVNKGQRFPDRSKSAHRKPLVKCFLTIPPILLYLFFKKKGPDQMSLVSINQPYRKVTINNKYNYQDNHHSSRPDTVGNTLKPSLWV